jgi:hypothetical protein
VGQGEKLDERRATVRDLYKRIREQTQSEIQEM